MDKSHNKPKFEIGRWYQNKVIKSLYIRPLELDKNLKRTTLNSVIWSDGEYEEHLRSSADLKYWTLVEDLSEIQKYLPNGHPDKFTNDLDKLLEEAKKRYPVGTKFKSAVDAIEKDKNYTHTIVGENFDWWVNNIYKKGEAIYEKNTSGLIYCHNNWAEIISKPEEVEDDFVLPKKWWIRNTLKTANEIYGWLNKNSDIGTTYNRLNYADKISPICYPSFKGYHQARGNDSYKEITFEQFKKYVLKQETQINKKEDDKSSSSKTNESMERPELRGKTVDTRFSISGTASKGRPLSGTVTTRHSRRQVERGSVCKGKLVE